MAIKVCSKFLNQFVFICSAIELSNYLITLCQQYLWSRKQINIKPFYVRNYPNIILISQTQYHKSACYAEDFFLKDLIDLTCQVNLNWETPQFNVSKPIWTSLLEGRGESWSYLTIAFWDGPHLSFQICLASQIHKLNQKGFFTWNVIVKDLAWTEIV